MLNSQAFTYIIISEQQKIIPGYHWKEGMYALLTAPGEDIYFVNPLKSEKNRFKHDKYEFFAKPSWIGTKSPK